MTKKEFENLKIGDTVYLNGTNKDIDIGEPCIVIDKVPFILGYASVVVKPMVSFQFLGKNRGLDHWANSYRLFSVKKPVIY